MRKGVVLEHKGRSTLVMTRRGEFIRAEKIAEADIGEEVIFRPKQSSSLYGFFTHRRVSIATIAFLLLFSLFPVYLWKGENKAYASVSIEINPSIEAKVNRDLEVISIRSLNSDGESVLKGISEIEGKKLTVIASELMKAVEEKGFLRNGKNALIAVSYLSDRHNIDIPEEIREFLKREHGMFQVAAYTVPFEWQEEAEKKGESVHSLVKRRLDREGEDVDIGEKDKNMIRTFYGSEKGDSPEKHKSEEPEKKEQKEVPAPSSKEESVPMKDSPSEQPATSDNKVSSPKGKNVGPPAPSRKEERPDQGKGSSSEQKGKEPARNKKGTHPEKKKENPPGNKQGPPGKEKDHPSQSAGKRGEEHPGKGNGPPFDKGDHPSGKKESHPGNKGNGPPSK